MPYAATYPVAVTLGPQTRVPDLVALDDRGRDELAALMIDVLTRLDRLYDRRLQCLSRAAGPWFTIEGRRR